MRREPLSPASRCVPRLPGTTPACDPLSSRPTLPSRELVGIATPPRVPRSCFWRAFQLDALVLLLLISFAGPAFSQATNNGPSAKTKTGQQPWQRKPFDAADELDEDRFRQNLLKVMMSLAQSSFRRYQAESSLFPTFGTSEQNEPIGVREALRGSTLLDLHEQGCIWLSLLLSSKDPTLRQFQDAMTNGLATSASLGSKQLRKQARNYALEPTDGNPSSELVVQKENEFSALLADLDATVPKNSDSKDYYDRILAKYRGYLQRQLPRTIDVTKPGTSTTFLFLNPRFGNDTPLEKDIHYQHTTEEAKDRHLITRDIRYQGIYVIRVTPLDSSGNRYHLAGFWLYLKINDPEMYVPRDPARALNSAGTWDLHHMPPAELSDEGLVSPAAEWMEVAVRTGRLVIVKGKATFLGRRAAPVDLALTPIDRLEPASGDIDSKVPQVPLDEGEEAALASEFINAASLHGSIRNPRMYIDEMPPLPGRFHFPDTPEGDAAFKQELAKAVSPFPAKAPGQPVSVPQPFTTVAPVDTKSAASPQPSVDPLEMRLEFGRLPAAGEQWLKAPYSAPGDMQQQRLQLALYWVSRFLEDAKTGNTQSKALQLLLQRLPGAIFCVNTQSVHLPHPITGGVVLAGMKNSFDASLPDIATDLLGAAESLVYQFNSGQQNAGEDRAEIAKLAQQYFASQPIDVHAPDPFLVATRAPQVASQEWRLLNSARVWDCPNPYRFFEASEGDGGVSAKLDGETVARLKEEKAIVTELGLDGVFNKDKQGNYRNDQGALSPLGLLFQLTLNEPSGLLLLGRAEENERVFAANALRAGNEVSARTHLAKANEIAASIESVKSLRKAVPNGYLDLYLTKPMPEKRSAGKSEPRAAGSATPAREAAAWRARWMTYNHRSVLIAGVRQSDIPIRFQSIEYLAGALNEKLPAGMSVLPALRLLKEGVQYSSDPQYGTYAAMFADMDRRDAASVAQASPPSTQ